MCLCRTLPLELPALVLALDVARLSLALVDDAPSEWDFRRDYVGSPRDGDTPPTGDSVPDCEVHQAREGSDR